MSLQLSQWDVHSNLLSCPMAFPALLGVTQPALQAIPGRMSSHERSNRAAPCWKWVIGIRGCSCSCSKAGTTALLCQQQGSWGEEKLGITFGMLFIITLQPPGKWTLENSELMVTVNTGKTQESANPLCCADRKILLQHTLAANLLQSLNPSWWAVGSQASETQPGVLF